MIYLSPSSLTRWFNQYDLDGKLFHCPAAWDYGRKYERLEPQPIAEQGIAVHKLLEGSLAPSDVTDTQTLTMFTKIAEVREMLGLTILHAEVRQEIKLLVGVTLVRIIDAIAKTKGGDFVLLDYKSTPGNGWKVMPNSIAPQSLGFQSPGYLMPPSLDKTKVLGLKTWPKTILYLIGPARGPAQYFTYESSAEDFVHFTKAAAQVAYVIRKNTFPKVKGKHCLNCPFQGPCYDLPDWRAALREKGKKESVPSDN